MPCTVSDAARRLYRNDQSLCRAALTGPVVLRRPAQGQSRFLHAERLRRRGHIQVGGSAQRRWFAYTVNCGFRIKVVCFPVVKERL